MNIPKKTIQYKLHKPIRKASEELGVCEKKLQKECRKNGINRWPARYIVMIVNMMIILEEYAEGEGERDKRLLYETSDILKDGLRRQFYE